MSVSSSDNPTETIVDILTNASTSEWTHDTPEIQKFHATRPKSRFSDPDPVLYVWQPTETDLQEQSADGTRLIEIAPAQVLMSTINNDDTVIMDYQRDVLQIVGGYLRDNESSTTWEWIQPDGLQDIRNEHNPQRTEQYLSAVNIQLQRQIEIN